MSQDKRIPQRRDREKLTPRKGPSVIRRTLRDLVPQRSHKREYQSGTLRQIVGDHARLVLDYFRAIRPSRGKGSVVGVYNVEEELCEPLSTGERVFPMPMWDWAVYQFILAWAYQYVPPDQKWTNEEGVDEYHSPDMESAFTDWYAECRDIEHVAGERVHEGERLTIEALGERQLCFEVGEFDTGVVGSDISLFVGRKEKARYHTAALCLPGVRLQAA